MTTTTKHLFFSLLFSYFLLLSFACSLSKGKTIVISPNQSINIAIKQCHSGDTILLHGGTYREVVNVNRSNLVIQAYPKEKVILTGCVEIKKWHKSKENYYKAFCKKEVKQLFLNKQMLLPARWPNFDSSMYSTQNWAPMYTKRDSAFFKGFSWPKNHWQGAWCFAIAGQKWVVNMETVKNSADSALKLNDKWFCHEGGNYTGKGEGFILKHLNALDTINEWHWQNDTIYVMLANEPKVLEAQVENIIIYGENCSNIELNNILVLGGRIQFKNAENIHLNNVDVLYATAPKKYEYSNLTSYAAIEFIDDSENCSVVNSIINGGWGGGIYLQGEDHLVNNCIVANCNFTGNGTANIATQGEGHTISNCDIYNSGNVLIQHVNTKKLSVLHNHLHDGGYLANDLGLTYAYATRGDGTEIAYNRIHDNHAKSAGVGIYIDIDSHDMLIHHNVVWNCLNGIQTIMSAYAHQIYNNTIWKCKKTINYWGMYGSNMYNQRVYNNIGNSVFDAATDARNNFVVNESPFVNAEKNDYQLLPNSKAIDFGCFIEGITSEHPDAGAYEFGEKEWKCGYDSSLVIE